MSPRPGAGGGAGPVRDAVRTFVDGLGPARAVVVAFSGGLDSCVLLHALRYGVGTEVDPAPTLIAAHFDHRMRDGSHGDASWARGVCRGWGVPAEVERAARDLASESEARMARYAFLERVRRGVGDDAVVLTAHHADDQAETVLFRILRGTGPDGVRGIPSVREPAIHRPLLGVWREDLEAYAAEVGLRWREDPTNEHLGYARNALRHEILPLIERTVAPGARKALARLAGLAAGDADAWRREVLPWLALRMGYERSSPADGLSGTHVAVDRGPLLLLSRGLRFRLIRYLAGEIGVRLDEAGVRRVDDFLRSSTSGHAIDLGHDATVGLELDRVVFAAPDRGRAPEFAPAEKSVVIETPGDGCRPALLDGRTVWVAWAEETGVGYGREGEASFDLERLAFPLEVRARRPGDRMRQRAGTRKVKKVLLEHRIPAGDRDTLPVVVDADGQVLWIPGVARSTVAEPRSGAPSLRIRIER